MLKLPEIDPVAFSIFGMPVRWYGLAYSFGFLLAYLYILHLNKKLSLKLPSGLLEDLIPWSVILIITGARLFYVIFYNPSYYWANLAKVIRVDEAGMSFHGGLLGAYLALQILARKHKVSWKQIADVAACAAPIGIFLGRIANFINRELCGRPTKAPWGIVFNDLDLVARHPSQLYEAALEGIALFVILRYMAKDNVRMEGRITGFFLIFYACFRALCECFREPDQQIGLLLRYFTMGQFMSTAMLLIGFSLLRAANRRKS